MSRELMGRGTTFPIWLWSVFPGRSAGHGPWASWGLWFNISTSEFRYEGGKWTSSPISPHGCLFRPVSGHYALSIMGIVVQNTVLQDNAGRGSVDCTYLVSPVYLSKMVTCYFL